jgi:predicted unusual protein kinase regulating ubiquinone biosynthesis (AarF/ABC1/UbiB family)
MLDPSLIPTRLLHPAERPPVEVLKVLPPPRFPATRTCFRFLSWAIGGLGLRIVARRGRRAEQARRLRLLLDELGGFWITVGQLLSIRSDLFSAELCQELSMLRDRAAGFPFETARHVAEAELGAPLTEIFDAFEDMPFAAASSGQLHKAHLRHENVWVAVKVQRPFLADVIARDLTLVRRIAIWLERLSIWPHARWRDGYWELEHILSEEVDYRFEASNIKRIRKTLRRHDIFVPKVFDCYSSRRLLVMEFIEGALMADYLQLMKTDRSRLSAWLVENNIDQQRVARQLALSMLRQALEDNLYHADLHPGNIILLRDSRIALIDCGAVGVLELEYLEKFRLFIRSLVELDYDKAADMVFLLSTSLPIRNLEHAKEDMVRSLRAWGSRTFVKQLPYQEKSVAAALAGVQQGIFPLQMCVRLANSQDPSSAPDIGCISHASLSGSKLHRIGPSIFPSGATAKSAKSRNTQVKDAIADEPGDRFQAAGKSQRACIFLRCAGAKASQGVRGCDHQGGESVRSLIRKPQLIVHTVGTGDCGRAAPPSCTDARRADHERHNLPGGARRPRIRKRYVAPVAGACCISGLDVFEAAQAVQS